MINVKKYISRIKDNPYAIVTYNSRIVCGVFEDGVFKQAVLLETENNQYEIKPIHDVELPDYVEDIRIVSKNVLIDKMLEYTTTSKEI